MFSSTFLGHQGWLFQTPATRLLVDPLLTENFGHARSVGAMYPPRVVNLGLFPAIDAVFISHEHEDHFDIPTLNRLERSIPIILSVRSSSAARQILGEMGFTVHLAQPGEGFRVGDLEVFFLTPDHVTRDHLDEWDVLPFLVRDQAGHGNFFSAVDTPFLPSSIKAFRQLVSKPGLWGCTNNSSNWSFLVAGEVEKIVPFDTLKVAGQLLEEEANLRAVWEAPVGMLICGGGLSFDADREWLNHNAFFADSARVATAMQALTPDGLFLAPTPGQTIHLRHYRVENVEAELPFLKTAPRASWPDREFRGDVELLEAYAPASGKAELAVGELEELCAHLNDLAAYFYGHGLFRGLHSLDGARTLGRKPALALALRSGDEYHVLEYRPHDCSFARVDCDDPAAAYLVGFECWAADLLGLFRGEFGSTAVTFGRSRTWSFMPKVVPLSPFELWRFFHPLRRPRSFLSLYRTLLGREPATVPRVRCGGAPLAEAPVVLQVFRPGGV